MILASENKKVKIENKKSEIEIICPYNTGSDVACKWKQKSENWKQKRESEMICHYNTGSDGAHDKTYAKPKKGKWKKWKQMICPYNIGPDGLGKWKLKSKS